MGDDTADVGSKLHEMVPGYHWGASTGVQKHGQVLGISSGKIPKFSNITFTRKSTQIACLCNSFQM
jgi:hypothetical protein